MVCTSGDLPELGISSKTPNEAQQILDEAIRAADLAAFESREAGAEWEAELQPMQHSAVSGKGLNSPVAGVSGS